MSMAKVVSELNSMVSHGVVRAYAIGGAVGAQFYLEVASTEDVDVFVLLSNDDPSSLDAFSPVYKYFLERGAKFDGVYIVIGDWPVQILPAPTRLHQEAVDDARTVTIGGQVGRVISPEYLALLALDLGRAKDKARLVEFLKLDSFDAPKFAILIEKHELSEKWRVFRAQFPTLT